MCYVCQIIQGIIDSAHCVNLKESGFQTAQEAITSNLLKFLAGSSVPSLFISCGQGIASKPGLAANQNTGVPSEVDKISKKSLHGMFF